MRGSAKQIRYPLPLAPGDRIGITAPSSGVPAEHFARLDLVLNHLRAQGFMIVEGECVRRRHKHVSGTKEERTSDFLRFWCDPSIKAIMPPWGGEILIEILPLLDFEEICQHQPKWISGYSDVSTLLFALTLKTGIATLHGSNLMDLAPAQTDPLTSSLLQAMQHEIGDTFTQHSSDKYQVSGLDYRSYVDAGFNLTEPTVWKSLSATTNVGFTGRIIGGCLDTIARLVGTSFGDLPAFIRAHKQEGVIFYFENCELTPPEVARTLWNIRLAGWFDGLAGIMIGRSSGLEASAPEDLAYEEVLKSVLGDLNIPTLYDVDIGHRPPNLNIINGSFATVEYREGLGRLTQALI